MIRKQILAAFVGGCMLAFAAPVHAQPLTERAAVQQGLEVAAWREWADASMDQARNRTRATGLLDNPEFEFIDESLDLPGGNTDRFYWLRQPLDLTGRNALTRKSARAAEGITAADVSLVRRQRAQEPFAPRFIGQSSSVAKPKPCRPGANAWPNSARR